MRAPQRLEREAELADGAGLEVLHEDVGRASRPRAAPGRPALEVEHDRFLAAVEPDEIGALAAGSAS